ncbi:MAG: class I SAM-dependent methyltransferase [Pirellulaceae bacterium]|jgi:SAM-dependent methyltransferase|nr:class I SAM-dependent methyltransferase [Pirellulaceae bacterium]
MFHRHGPTFWELARQALSSTERGYDLLAPKFDYTPFRTPAWLLQPVADFWSQDTEQPPFRAGLDVCCGTGAGMQLLRPYCREQVVGWDMSQGMLDVASEHSRSWDGAAAVEFVRGDVLAPCFESRFDAAVCFGALGHILPRDAAQFYANIHRALEDGGRLFLLTAPMPRLWTLRYWLGRGFNGAMHIRNLLIRPPFIMFYLTHTLPELVNVLEQVGFSVESHSGLFPRRAAACRLIVATKQKQTAETIGE